MATVTRIHGTDPEAAGRAWLEKTDDEILACYRQFHDIPRLILKKGKLPRGVAVQKQQNGVFQITQTCRVCGTKRTLTTMPGGRLDLVNPSQYTYEHPPGYRPPPESGVTGRQAFAELWRRVQESLVLGEQEGDAVKPLIMSEPPAPKFSGSRSS